MKLSKNALGNLIHRYQAVLSKCAICNTFGTLAMAGMLCAGTVGLAQAATTPTWGDDKEITIASGESVEVSGAAAVKAKNLTIASGGTLTLKTLSDEVFLTEGKEAGSLKVYGTLNSSGGGIMGIQRGDPWAYYGTAEVSGSGASLDFTSGGSISAKTIKITGGATGTLSGVYATGLGPHLEDGAWRRGSQLYAGESLTLTDSGTVITLEENGLLGAGSPESAGKISMTITNDAQVMMASGSLDSGGASVIRVTDAGGSGATLTVSSGGLIDVASGGYGVIAAPNIVIDGAAGTTRSAIRVASGGHLEITDKLLDTSGAHAMSSGAGDFNGVTMQGGNLTITNGGNLRAVSGNFVAGTINLIGHVQSGGRSGIYGEGAPTNAEELTFGSGDSANTKLTVNITSGGGIEGAAVNISGGKFIVEGKGNASLGANADWTRGSVIGANVLKITGGDITLGAYGQMYAEAGNNSGMFIEGGTVHLAGGQTSVALLRACDSGSASGAMTIGGGTAKATVDVASGHYGVIMGSDILVSGSGNLTVEQGGSLLVRKDATADEKKSGGSIKAGAVGLTVDGTQLTVSGGALNVHGDVVITDANDGTHNGILTVATGGTATITGHLTTSGGSLNMSGGSLSVSETIHFGDLEGAGLTSSGAIAGTIVTGALDFAAEADRTAGFTINNDVTATFLGVGDGKQSFFNGAKITIDSGAGLNLGSSDTKLDTKGGTYSGALTFGTSGGSLTVNAGNWHLTDTASGAHVGASGALNISGGSLTVDKLKVDASGSVTIGTSGNMSTALKNFGSLSTSGGTSGSLTYSGDTDNIAAGTVTNDGRLSLTGSQSGSMTLTDFGKITSGGSQFASGKGTLSIDNIKVTASSGNTLTEVSNAHAEVGDSNVSVSGSVTMTGGGALVGGLTASGASVSIDTSGNNLTIIGGKAATNGQLISNLGSGSATITGDLTLGDNKKLISGGGTLTGQVSGNVSAFNGTFKVTGDVQGATVAQGGNLTVNSVSSSGAHVAAGANGSHLTVTKDVSGGVTIASGSTNSLVSVGGNVSGGDITIEGKGSVVNITGDANLGTDEVAMSAASSLIVGKTLTTSGADISNGSSLRAATLKTTDDITVGSDEAGSAGHLSVGTLDLGGKILLVDPAWTPNGKSNLNDAATVAIGGFSGANIHGQIIVGQQSMVTVGDTEATWLKNEVARQGGWGKDGIAAALGIRSQIKLSSGSGDYLVVDGSVVNDGSGNATSGAMSGTPPTSGDAYFAGNSLLVVDVNSLKGETALVGDSSGGTLTVKAGAKLRLATDAVIGKYTIASGFKSGNVESSGWGANMVQSPDRMINSVGTWDSGSFTVNAGRNDASSTFRHLDGEMGGLVNRLYDLKVNSVHSSNAGIRFVSRAVNSDYLANADRVAPTIEGAAQLAVVGATQGMTLSASTAATTAVTTRTSFASPLNDKTRTVALNMSEGQVQLDEGVSAGDSMKNGLGLWIMPLYQSNNVWGMKSGEFKTGYTSDLGGVALGADYTFAEAFRVGLALNMGGGYAQSHGDFSKTDNSFNFWGVNLYGGWSQNNFGITADVGYTGNYNKLKQETDPSMQMGDTKADVTSSAITAGLRGEYKFATEVVDIIPHISVRYTSLMTDGYDAKNNGTVFEADQSNQSIWTFPIGVTFTKEIESSSGWIFKPQVDLQVVPAAGDVKAKSKVRIPGIDRSAELKTRVVDDFSYGGGVGFDVKKDNVSFGINYNIQASEHSTAHGVFGTFRYEF